MNDSKGFFRQTAETASFAFREYFRPLLAVVRFLKPSPASSTEGEGGNTHPTAAPGKQTPGKAETAEAERARE
jgi:hypothetical protein